MLSELGYELGIEIATDSTSAQAAAARRGVLHAKHMAIRLLCVKELTEQGVIKITRVPSLENEADWLTKPLGQQAFERCLQLLPGLHREVTEAG